jgi:hypothetical protein
MFSLRQHRSRNGGSERGPSTPDLDETVVSVSVSADVLEDYPGLADALGDGFTLVVDQPHECAVAVVGPIGAVACGSFGRSILTPPSSSSTAGRRTLASSRRASRRAHRHT